MSADAYEALRRRLPEAYPGTGETAAENVALWLAGQVPFVPAAALADFLENAPIDLVHESFWRNLPFGTGGIRGTVGFGPGRINPTVVALTIQAHCEYLDEFFAQGRGAGFERSVVIANDVREFHDSSGTLKFLRHNPYHARTGVTGYQVTSRNLAYLAAGVYARNGYLVYLLSPHDDAAFLTTPELSFLIRRLRAVGGINLSASHNPPDDNGVKVYDQNGGQYLPPDDEDLTKRTRDIRRAVHLPYPDAVAAGLVRDVPAEALADYMSLYVDRGRARGLASERGTRILFTPLCGCGARTVRAGLEQLGYAVEMPAAEGPDGTFGAIPMRIANPEVPESTGPAKAAARAFGATLVLASDPDADRLGAEVFHRGQWRHLTGNQIATILAYYLLLDPDGPQLRGAVYETIVTTLAVGSIAERAGCAHVVTDLLVGFKYIGGEVLEYSRRLPGADDEALLSFAAEESHGYLDNPHVRDKDALAGAPYLAKLHERLSATGETIIDYLDRVYERVGPFGDRGRSVVILGSVGVRAIQAVMRRLRESRPAEFAGVAVKEVIDRRAAPFPPKTTDTDWAARNLLTFKFADGQILFRPSGTEPKLKFYVMTRGAPHGVGAQDYADALCDRVYQEILGLLGPVYREDLGAPHAVIALDAPFAALPDVVPLEAKLELQHDVARQLRELVAADDQGIQFVARWLAERVGALVPGEAAWRIVEPAIRSAATGWDDEEARRIESVFAYLGEHLG